MLSVFIRQMNRKIVHSAPFCSGRASFAAIARTPVPSYCFGSLKELFSDTIRLNTGSPGFESL